MKGDRPSNSRGEDIIQCERKADERKAEEGGRAGGEGGFKCREWAKNEMGDSGQDD